jgi:hypothetical protein
MGLKPARANGFLVRGKPDLGHFDAQCSLNSRKGDFMAFFGERALLEAIPLSAKQNPPLVLSAGAIIVKKHQT